LRTWEDNNAMEYPKSIEEVLRRYQQIKQAEADVSRAEAESDRQKLRYLSQRYGSIKPSPQKSLTIPVIFNRTYDENFISDYLAYVLHPARNGIGIGPLERLFDACEIDVGDINLEEVSIIREYTLENGRIDLFLEWEDQFILGIENKIYSSEGEHQTEYYARVIGEKFSELDCHLIYLTRDGHKASSPKFLPLSYRKLYDALTKVSAGEGADGRKIYLWNDFLEHLERYIIMTTNDHFELSEKAKLYIEYHDMLRDLERAFKEDWSRLVETLEIMVKEQISRSWTTRFNKSSYYHQIVKPAWEPNGVMFVHFEYFFDLDRWEKQNIAFMVDVEGRINADEFQALFDKRYPDLALEYEKRGIQYKPRQRRIAIAWKEYAIPQDIKGVSQVFVDAFNEFQFLETEIDHIIEQMSKS
jgi:hypothetical protein